MRKGGVGGMQELLQQLRIAGAIVQGGGGGIQSRGADQSAAGAQAMQMLAAFGFAAHPNRVALFRQFLHKQPAQYLHVGQLAAQRA